MLFSSSHKPRNITQLWHSLGDTPQWSDESCFHWFLSMLKVTPATSSNCIIQGSLHKPQLFSYWRDVVLSQFCLYNHYAFIFSVKITDTFMKNELHIKYYLPWKNAQTHLFKKHKTQITSHQYFNQLKQVVYRILFCIVE